MTTYLNLGKLQNGTDVLLPASATEKMAIIGVSGSGKSYAAGRVVEQWYAGGVLVAILDPVGIFFGLRCATDRDPAKGLPVYIYGGPKGDFPLPQPDYAAGLFAEWGLNCVFDMAAFPLETIHWWGAEFFKRLMELGPVVESPRQVIVEEAPIFAPQSGMGTKWGSPCRAAFAHFMRVGGNHGYGATIISQRAQSVDKNVLTQCGSLLLLRIAAGLDRRAITDWVANYASDIDVKAMLEELSHMPVGEGCLWAPTWADGLELQKCRVKIGQRITFHPDRKDPAANRAVQILQLIREPEPWVPLDWLGAWAKHATEFIRSTLGRAA